MRNNNAKNLQYNSCLSKGICSVNPRVSALQNVLGLYLHLCAKYYLKLLDKDSLDKNIRDFFINTVAISISNSELSESGFMDAISKLKEIMPEIIKKYNEIYGEEDFKDEDILSSDIFRKCINIIDAIKLGETIFRKNAENISSQVRDMFKIILIIAKSLSINMLDLESYGNYCQEGFREILNLLNAISKENTDIEYLKNIILKAVECDIFLVKTLHKEQENRYGKQGECEVSYTTTPAKAVLVVGSNIRELETVLNALKDTDINVYTHDEMMKAHTFPNFRKYTNLKGQYGYGIENCLIDFATFPGPIILTKHSLHNIENFYRGRLFTTDTNFCKGVVKIENNDFSEVIEAANNAKGFKTGKTCETVSIGYDYKKGIDLIDKKLSTNQYKKIMLIGINDYSDEHNSYFEKLMKFAPKDNLIISFSYNYNINNRIHFNACYDNFAILRIFDYIKNYDIPINIFMPKCDRNTISEVIFFKKFKNVKIYIGKCESVFFNPTLCSTLCKIFSINNITSPQKDLDKINNEL